MKFLPFLFIILTFNAFSLKIDFGIGKKGNNWFIVNDGVMGGLSKGEAKIKENSILFIGEVSLDNNGGFSSLRSRLDGSRLSEFSQVKIRYRSKGISLAMSLQVDRRWYIPNYKKSLSGTEGEWKTITVKLTDFRKYYIGRPMDSYLSKTEIKEIIRMGFITNEKKYGSFEFEIDYIEFF